MTNTPFPPGRWIVRFALIISCALAARAQGGEELRTSIPDVIRGQSPSPSSVQAFANPFVGATSPWVSVAQETTSPPQVYSTGQARVAQQPPMDPFATPYGGVPTYGGPGLGGA